MQTSQATTLNALFHSLTGWALNHLKEGALARFRDVAEACAKAAALEDWAQDQVWLIAAFARLNDPLTLDAAKKCCCRTGDGSDYPGAIAIT